ncbi:hypothetical protein POM88_011825 [Heracleum sosnowskyi]|uniref:Uncharacterized protein n=1 Tax=Heracleum sosnowskyi TaxID=360622 RepID=A0AAD8IV94_9APIA|nr:hypothetical protein POM88_011825 [Heracleum sosnowskyi]
MLSTVNLELSSFINPELTWKKVKKGCRSTTRRPRNSLNQNLNVGTELSNKNCNRDQDSSESEKWQLGVAVLGRRFAEKIVDVPIKKRRLLIRPPSPPSRTLLPDDKGSLLPQPQTPQHAIEPEQIVDIKPSGAGRHLSLGSHYGSQKWIFDKSLAPKFEGKVDEVPFGKKYELLKAGYASNDDFSGIELLARAACSSSINNDIKLEETCALKAFAKAEAVDIPNTTIPFLESIASSVTSHITGTELVNEDDMGTELVNEDDMGESAVDRTTIAAVSKNENDVVVRSRAHWDLNTLMEEWEEPDDVTPIDGQMNYSEIVPGATHCETISIGNSTVQSNLDGLRDAKIDGQSVVRKEVPSHVGCIKELADGIGVVIGRSCIDEDTLKTCSSPNETYIEKQYFTTPEHGKDAFDVAAYDTIAYLPLRSIEASGNNLSTELPPPASLHVFEDKMYASANCELEQVGEVSCATSVKENRKLSSEFLEVGKLKLFTSDLPLQNSIGHETNDTQTKDCNLIENTTGSPDRKTSPGEVMKPISFKTSDVGNSMGELYRANHFDPSPKSEALSASSTYVGIGEVKLLSNKASAADSNVIDVAVKDEPKRLLDISDCPSKFDQDNNISDCYDKDGNKANIKHISEYEAGYDSSFEDGELRESGVYTWGENDFEAETECVDYNSDYGDGDDIEKVGDGENRLAKAGDSEPLKQCFNGSILDGSHSACTEANISSGNWFDEHMEYGVAEGNVDGYNDKSVYAGEFRSRAFRSDLSSFSKGPSPFDAMERNRYLGVHRNRFDNSNYSYPRAERGFGPEKSRGRGRFSYKPFVSRSETDGQWVGCPTTYRDTRNSCHGPDGHAYSRPRDVTAFSTKFGGFNYEDDRRSIIHSSNGSCYRSSMGRRSQPDRDDSYVDQRGISPVRDIDQYRSRGRSRQYTQGIRRVPGVEYSENMPDDAAQHPIRKQPYFCRRGRGFSPNYRGGNFSHRNSCSRSPTRSPVAWNSQRDRNMNTRRHSPDFRSDARREIIGSRLKKNSYGADEEIYLSPPKIRVPPHSNSRWFNSRNYTNNHFRDRKSPVRMVRGGRQGMDFIGYSGKRSDGIVRPNIHSGRFQEESIDEKISHDDRYEINYRVRRYNTGGAVRRFRYDADDCFEARNTHNDDNVGLAAMRDIPGDGAGEERGPRYNSGDRM